jgi:hypothetical protein|nr:MAG TPA: hypothetical protein [Caudoviricetes sp.]DAZ64786.1 MAG TPA: hypothetical protein [Caudoviricetes sp.]
MMFGQQPYVYQQPIYNQPIGQPISQPMQEPMMRPQYQPAPQMSAYQPQPQQPQNQSIIWIPNEQAANDFIVAPNNAVTLWDMNAPVVYVKKADASGKPSMIVYDLVERAQAAPAPAAPRKDMSEEYVTRREFEELVAKLSAPSVRPRKMKEADNEPTV